MIATLTWPDAIALTALFAAIALGTWVFFKYTND